MVTGGDALLRVAIPGGVPARDVTVRVNGTDVTSRFAAGSERTALVGLVTNLAVGENAVAVSAGRVPPTTLTVVNYPVTGPVFSGPKESPFICETDKFKLTSGGMLGPALDADCSVRTRVDYAYRSTAGGNLKPLADPAAAAPADVARTSANGANVPYIVRVETGTINRAIYQIAMLHDPSRDAAPDFRARGGGWNGRLIYTFGGGCAGGWYRQGRATGGVEDDVMLRQGYAVASATLNVFGNNCDDLLAAETMMMVKERFIEAYGPPAFTIGWGCSGGSYQGHQIADNYPGLLDGIVVGCSFPDVAHAAVSMHSFGARLLHHYFEAASIPWTPEQRVAASGLPDATSLRVQGTRPDRLVPRGVCDPAIPAALLYDPVKNPKGARCTVYDHAVNVYGRDPANGIARRALDNVGVQYGLKALKERKITPAQFLDLNENIGGIDADANFVAARTVGDPLALKAAYQTGRVLHGGGGLAATPVIDYRGYADFAEGDPHMRFHSFSTRERLIAANGHADNHVMLVEDGAKYGLFSTRSPVVQDALRQMDRWLTTLVQDSSTMSRPEKVVHSKPKELADACFDKTGTPLVETQRYGAGACHALFPAHSSPYHVAGMPLANNIVKCELRPIRPADDAAGFTDAERDRLRRIFPSGVCDYSKAGVMQQRPAGQWLSFGPSPANRYRASQSN
jgi:hypothetical protein